jgi:hypothetical protein
MSCTQSRLEEVIAARGGVLKSGTHTDPAGECCILEAVSICQGIPYTDSPEATGMPDLRPLNDALWSSDLLRTHHMVKVASALADWWEWSNDRQQRWAKQVAIQTVRQIVSGLPGLMDAIRESCRKASTLSEAAEAAARAAEAAEAAEAAAWAAEAAARAATWAAMAAARAATWATWAAAEAAAEATWAAAEAAAEAAEAADKPLITACAIWIQAATDAKG